MVIPPSLILRRETFALVFHPYLRSCLILALLVLPMVTFALPAPQVPVLPMLVWVRQVSFQTVLHVTLLPIAPIAGLHRLVHILSPCCPLLAPVSFSSG